MSDEPIGWMNGITGYMTMNPRYLKQQQEKSMDELSSELFTLMGEITGRIAEARTLSDHVGRGTGGREVSLCITNLQQANMWLKEAAALLFPTPVMGQEAYRDANTKAGEM